MANKTRDETSATLAAAQRQARRDVFPLLTDPVSRVSAPRFEENLRRGAKPEAAWMCGVEFELFGYDTAREYARLEPAQVQRVLAGFAPSSNDLVYESRVLIEVDAGQMNRLTVEPGGQVEFSGAPQRGLGDIEREVKGFLTRLGEIADGGGLTFLAVGFDPLRTLEEQRWFPKARYEVMRPYLATRGARAWDMMTRTCAVQTNLDYGSVEDLAKKFFLGNRLAPIVTAIFANSPFQEGKLSGYKSTRAAVWLETDADRTGIARSALGETFTPADFVSYALEVPMIFAQRDGIYLEAPTGMKFGEFLDGGCDGVQPVFGDWADHLTTLFTDARLKQHIELRSADCGDLSHTLALQALWKGLMYDDGTLDEALRIAPKLDQNDALRLREEVAVHALAASCAGVNVLDLAIEIVKLAAEGLGKIAPDEVRYLDILKQNVVDNGVSPADILIRNWNSSWRGSMDQVIEYLRVV
jgi:glutamate--cysteine ligase